MFQGQCATNTDNLQLLIAPAPAHMLGRGQAQVEIVNPTTGPLSQILVNLDFPGPESLEMTLTIQEFHQITYLFIPKCKREAYRRLCGQNINIQLVAPRIKCDKANFNLRANWKPETACFLRDNCGGRIASGDHCSNVSC